MSTPLPTRLVQAAQVGHADGVARAERDGMYSLRAYQGARVAAVAFLHELLADGDHITHTPDGDYISIARIRALAEEIEAQS